MNTPAHAIFNLFLLGRGKGGSTTAPVLLGAVLPDLPMFLFYLVQKLMLGTPERTIWTESYFDGRWQDFFDVFNSLPLVALGILLCWGFRQKWMLLLFSSMLLHIALDLPLHHDDAHRHFLPFSSWRFESPVSYWDPEHYGAITAPLEAMLVLAGSLALWRRYPARTLRISIAAVGGLYLVYLVFALVFWLD